MLDRMALPVSVGVYVLLFTFFLTDLEEVCMQWYILGKKRTQVKLDFQPASFRIKAFIIRTEEDISGSGISGTDKTISNVV